MARNDWEIDFGDVEELVEKLKKMPDESEKVINDVIHNDGIKIATEEIQPEIPVSKWRNRVRNKKHARDNKNPQSSKKENLAFTIRPQKKFEYLKYPDLSIGTSKNKQPKRFMKKGLDKASPKIIEKLNEKIDEKINETLNGGK
ncbi:HK97-gp10 family putative phage morphogenesis protein [Schinkia azotoformans]|uniref:HK97-gp10 family putative phage morphogenesis protein n=1 Tax=Schinkia azotoformans TaxID=1454 RepID=UPI002DBB4252|nr:HK97-gp10 family putative phage morphogenesis protein [Schinkia azotoformans]MEC1778402.1 hypothetical protein [Schinkia azotoformans]MED4328353.1 hypothetical protein [Schinkia azotoformans]